MNNSNNSNLSDKFKCFFGKGKIVKKGDLGIYHYVWSCDVYNGETSGNKHDVFIKLRAIEIYDNLVEGEIVDINISDLTNQNLMEIIKLTVPKYFKIKYVKWIRD